MGAFPGFLVLFLFMFNIVEWERLRIDILTGNHLYNPHVVHVPGEEYEFKMWFFGWPHADTNPGYPGADAIFHARSKDLNNWEVWTGGGWDATGNTGLWVPVLHSSSTGPGDPNHYYDGDHCGDPSVVKKDGVYYMAYSAAGMDLDGYRTGHPSDTDWMLSVVCMATSTDGINWIRASDPILMHDAELGKKEHDTSDPDYVTYAGEFHRPSLMWDEDRWRIWFDYWAPYNQGTSTGHAECYGDPMVRSNWNITHNLAQPVLLHWVNPDVVKHNGTYYLYGDPSGYPGYDPWTDWRSRQTKEAVSSDGVNWTVTGFIDPDPDVETAHVPEAFVVDRDGHAWLYIFFGVQVGGEPYNFRYDRIRYMRKRLD